MDGFLSECNYELYQILGTDSALATDMITTFIEEFRRTLGETRWNMFSSVSERYTEKSRLLVWGCCDQLADEWCNG